jgi:hypothetical protein
MLTWNQHYPFPDSNRAPCDHLMIAAEMNDLTYHFMADRNSLGAGLLDSMSIRAAAAARDHAKDRFVGGSNLLAFQAKTAVLPNSMCCIDS